MANCGIILAIIVVLAFLLLFWWVLQLDAEDDTCNTPKIPKQDPNYCKAITDCMTKFAQLEHEIDTLFRSYIIEYHCSCRDADNTFERIMHLCEKLGDYIAIPLGRQVGDKYATGRKRVCQQLREIVDNPNHTIVEGPTQNISGIPALLSNTGLARNFIETIEQDRYKLVLRMLDAHRKGDSLGTMVAYDSLKEKTDLYVESVMTSTYKYQLKI